MTPQEAGLLRAIAVQVASRLTGPSAAVTLPLAVQAIGLIRGTLDPLKAARIAAKVPTKKGSR